ncbi:lysozyme inhibitor LprI family protein [Novosphingobium sp. FSW06-99]|uniref:lysozyme inhibitor LprI family protein n=1 Tax=Novosphingobium sp. FSW06-99 TaxID=1739113 RepID=UPI003518A086
MNATDAPCRNSVVTADLTQCLDQAERSADDDLNKTYQTIAKVLTVEERPALLTAQRLWLRYRDASCSAERSLYGGGTGQGPAFLACMEAETRHHTAELRTAYWWRVEKFSP